MQSQYYLDLKEIKEKRCPTCYGSGEIDDAEPGDIGYNEWTCTLCDGSGYYPHMTKEEK